MPCVHAVILNYKRRNNIAPIVRTCLNVTGIDRIHVIDQAVDPDQQLRTLPKSLRVVAMRAPNIGAGRRLFYSAGLPCDLVIGIDDDIFLSPDQITELIGRAVKNPSRIHGIWGQLVVEVDGRLSFKRGITRVNRPVDILNRVYAFTPEHARNAVRIAHSLGLFPGKLRVGDDILLGFGAARQPMCHDLGPMHECTTSNRPGVAVWKQAGFHQNRTNLINKLRAIGYSWTENDDLRSA